MIQEYPFRVSALANQSVVDTKPAAYPFRDKVLAEKPVLIEDKGDAVELLLIVAVLSAVCVSVLFFIELMSPGWSVTSMFRA